MKLLLLLITISLCSCMKDTNEISIFHYNIKELDSSKLRDLDNKQISAVKNIVSEFQFDIFSVNEIQYDLPMIPVKEFKTTGQNINILAKRLELDNFSAVFYPANTGVKAMRAEDGNYAKDFKSKEARKLADPVNFGIFPGQYSTGALVKNSIKILSSKNINNVKWKDFNPSIDLTKFTDSTGKPLDDNIKLFDKNLTDILAEKDGFKFHIVLLHTVPAFHFGNKKTPNYQRNADQLRFLEWYLTQETDIEVTDLDVSPIEKDSPFIAIGDWNTELNNTKNPGSTILRRLKEKSQFWMKEPLPVSNESASFAPERLKLQLDYIAVSDHFKILDSGTYRPDEQRKDLGCKTEIKGNNIRSYKKNRDSKETCYSSFNPDFIEAKSASDHYPIWARLEVK